MTVRRVERFELSVDSGAALLYAAATAVALYLLNASAPYMCLAGMVAFGWCLVGLRSVQPESEALTLPYFTPAAFTPMELDELVLTEADRIQTRVDSDALILDDILAQLGPDSRVVRLFDPSKMPTAGQLKTRIDDHLDQSTAAPPDASQALYAALAELKRSLR